MKIFFHIAKFTYKKTKPTNIKGDTCVFGTDLNQNHKIKQPISADLHFKTEMKFASGLQIPTYLTYLVNQ